MKRKFIAMLLAALCLLLIGCTPDRNTPSAPTGGVTDGTTDEPKDDPTGTTDDNTPPEDKTDEKEEITEMYISVNGNKLTVKLAQNSATAALTELLKKGDITYAADDYGGFEKVGALGHSLPTSNTQITTQAGDVMLYNGSNIVIFYGSNSWSYTRIGKIEGYTAASLRAALGSGNVTVTLSIK